MLLIDRQFDELDPPQTLNGRQMYWMLNNRLQVGATDRPMIEYDALKYMSIKGDNLAALINDWDSALDACTNRRPDDILLNLWDTQVQRSPQFAQTYAMYEMKIVHEGAIKDYEVLFEMARKHVEEKAREKNVTAAKAGGTGAGLVGKGGGKGKTPKTKADAKPKAKPPGVCRQWASQGTCSRGRGDTYPWVKSHDLATPGTGKKSESRSPKKKADGNKDPKKTQSPSAKTRTGTSPSGKANARMCHFYTKEKCKNGDKCDYYHIPVCNHFKAGTCTKGKDCLYHHPGTAAPAASEQSTEEEAETKPKRNGCRSSSPKAKATAKGNLALAMCAILTLCSSPGAEASTTFASFNNSTAHDAARYEGAKFALAAQSSPTSLSVNFSE